MAFITNNDKMLESVLMNEELMKFGGYEPKDICGLYQALDSDNIVISAVAQIIRGASEGASEREIYKVVTEYLKRNV